MNVEGLLIWTRLAFFGILVVNLILIALVADWTLNEERFRFWANAFLIEAWKYKISFAGYWFALIWSCTEVESLLAGYTLFFRSVKIPWKLAFYALIIRRKERLISRTFYDQVRDKQLFALFCLWPEYSTFGACWTIFCGRIKKLVWPAVNTVSSIEVW